MVRRPLGNHHVGPDTHLVTSDTTQQTVPVAEETQSQREMIDPELIGLLRGTRVVLLDFDGPICRLFAGRPALGIAELQERWLESQGLGEMLTEEERELRDPHGTLARLARDKPRTDLVMALEQSLTAQELRAVPTAWPTPYADPLIRTWCAVGVRLAITTNNSAEAARRYVHDRGLSGCFEPHIYGREASELTRLKPDPWSLQRALNAMGADPARTLMVGDAASDCAAASAAGVSFLGYARNATKAAALREAGARHLVTDLEPVLIAVRALG
ncbi:HAD family hydrolase [Streptomyces xanthii]|uniref:HAD family phosphatase n=1 Tax=Streptomyces xanthii TaxID=2768069 RepID=A0A7H1B8G2_9ACTN|nr:HAD family hydrolase [Streptomyces xanthii]QNS05017.1 HAD family phosphatase [Streptomyces xanthii]